MEMGKGGREIEMAVRFLAHGARDFRHPRGIIGRIAEAPGLPRRYVNRLTFDRVAIPRVGAAAGDAAKAYASMIWIISCSCRIPDETRRVGLPTPLLRADDVIE